ncbi:uncharacterized protein LOC135471890 [Liolophura sinensis]|uniref:uncharacterized protein LOC135471890 n=1 Tax=Liolophura sinensis TaxID=3198878 RepID=UPI003158052B
MNPTLVVFSLCLAFCLGAVPHDRIAKIFKDFDKNGNEIVSDTEAKAFFTVYKQSASDTFVKKDLFVSRWMRTYHDSRFVSEALYDKVDMNKDGLLTDADIPIFYSHVDKNKNGIEWAEFEKVYLAWYNELE